MLGIPVQDREKFIHWSRIIVNLSYSMAGGEHAARAAREHAAIKPEMEQYISELLEQRRHVPKDDLFSHLVQAEVDGEHLSDADILGFFQLLLSAATETTTNLITNAVLCFSENPHQLRKLKASPELMPLAIEEVLRYRSPAQIAFRQTKRDVEMHGQKIPAGKFVLAMIGSANRDSKEFPNASEFDILRTPNPHLAFGHGIHFCLGSALARLQTRIALTDLYFRLLSVEVIDNQRWKPRQALHVHGPASLPVHLGTPVGALAPRRFGRLLHHGSAH
jgi:cytochrome P450